MFYYHYQVVNSQQLQQGACIPYFVGQSMCLSLEYIFIVYLSIYMLEWVYPCPFSKNTVCWPPAHTQKLLFVRAPPLTNYCVSVRPLVCVHSAQTIVSSHPLLQCPHFVWIIQKVFQVSDNTEQAKSKYTYLKSWSFLCIHTCFLINHLIWSKYHKLNQIKTSEYNWECLSILPPGTWLNNHGPVRSLYFQP